MTLSLYTLHSTPEPGEFIIQKFDTDYHCESVYALTQSECQCPQGNKPRCRHRTMLPMFLKHGHIGDGWFLEWDTRLWRKPVQGAGLNPKFTEETCPGHVASEHDPKVCGRCGTHINSLRPLDDDIYLADETVMGTSASAERTATLTSPPAGAEVPSPEAPPPSPPEGPQPSLSAEAAPASPVVAGAPIVKRRKIP